MIHIIYLRILLCMIVCFFPEIEYDARSWIYVSIYKLLQSDNIGHCSVSTITSIINSILITSLSQFDNHANENHVNFDHDIHDFKLLIPFLRQVQDLAVKFEKTGNIQSKTDDLHSDKELQKHVDENTPNTNHNSDTSTTHSDSALICHSIVLAVLLTISSTMKLHAHDLTISLQIKPSHDSNKMTTISCSKYTKCAKRFSNIISAVYMERLSRNQTWDKLKPCCTDVIKNNDPKNDCDQITTSNTTSDFVLVPFDKIEETLLDYFSVFEQRRSKETFEYWLKLLKRPLAVDSILESLNRSDESVEFSFDDLSRTRTMFLQRSETFSFDAFEELVGLEFGRMKNGIVSPIATNAYMEKQTHDHTNLSNVTNKIGLLALSPLNLKQKFRRKSLQTTQHPQTQQFVATVNASQIEMNDMNNAPAKQLLNANNFQDTSLAFHGQLQTNNEQLCEFIHSFDKENINSTTVNSNEIGNQAATPRKHSVNGLTSKNSIVTSPNIKHQNAVEHTQHTSGNRRKALFKLSSNQQRQSGDINSYFHFDEGTRRDSTSTIAGHARRFSLMDISYVPQSRFGMARMEDVYFYSSKFGQSLNGLMFYNYNMNNHDYIMNEDMIHRLGFNELPIEKNIDVDIEHELEFVNDAFINSTHANYDELNQNMFNPRYYNPNPYESHTAVPSELHSTSQSTEYSNHQGGNINIIADWKQKFAISKPNLKEIKDKTMKGSMAINLKFKKGMQNIGRVTKKIESKIKHKYSRDHSRTITRLSEHTHHVSNNKLSRKIKGSRSVDRSTTTQTQTHTDIVVGHVSTPHSPFHHGRMYHETEEQFYQSTDGSDGDTEGSDDQSWLDEDANKDISTLQRRKQRSHTFHGHISSVPVLSSADRHYSEANSHAQRRGTFQINNNMFQETFSD